MLLEIEIEPHELGERVGAQARAVEKRAVGGELRLTGGRPLERHVHEVVARAGGHRVDAQQRVGEVCDI